jgi:hypothetical protein
MGPPIFGTVSEKKGKGKRKKEGRKKARGSHIPADWANTQIAGKNTDRIKPAPFYLQRRPIPP